MKMDLPVSYRAQELEGAKDLVDFLSNINPCRIADRQVLESWTAYFRSLRVPYLIRWRTKGIEKGRRLQLIKRGTAYRGE